MDEPEACIDCGGTEIVEGTCVKCQARDFGPARFWVYYKGSPVRLTLRDDQAIELVEGGPTEEGYDWRHSRYSLCRGLVTLEWHDVACDCDGPTERGGASVCEIADLQTGAELEGIRYPAWERENAYQRDLVAEAAGY